MTTFAFDIKKSDSIIEHGFGTRDLIVQAWQNNYPITPDIALKSDDEIRVFAAGASETSPIRLIIFPVGSSKSSEEESSGSTKSTKSKTSRSTRSKTS